MDGYPVSWVHHASQGEPLGRREPELWEMGLLLTARRANLQHFSVALHFFWNTTQNPLPPEGMPKWLPEQDELYLHGAREARGWKCHHSSPSWGRGCRPPPGLARKINSAWVVRLPCVPRTVKHWEGSRQFQFIYKPRAIFSSLIPGGPHRALGWRQKLGKAS